MDDAITPAPFPLADTLRPFPGLFVAVDLRTAEAVVVDESPYVVSARVREQGLRNVAIVRAPEPDEPHLVGLG